MRRGDPLDQCSSVVSTLSWPSPNSTFSLRVDPLAFGSSYEAAFSCSFFLLMLSPQSFFPAIAELGRFTPCNSGSSRAQFSYPADLARRQPHYLQPALRDKTQG